MCNRLDTEIGPACPRSSNSQVRKRFTGHLGIWGRRRDNSPHRAARVASALIVLLGQPAAALAWGSEGHRIVAEIAEQYLDPATARQVSDLLAIENATTLAQVSTWADDLRPQRRETARWHFVDIPIHPAAGTPTAYDVARDCALGNCVVAAIERFTAVLRDNATPARERFEALKFIVHFVADVHQPLPTSDDGDKGGNAIHVTFMGRSTNLHAVWDWGILAPAVAGDERGYALRLTRSITPAQAEQWRRGSPTDWANESYGIARRLIYGEWPHAPGALPADYEAEALPVVNVQLERVGVRLAAVLNAALTVAGPRR